MPLNTTVKSLTGSLTRQTVLLSLCLFFISSVGLAKEFIIKTKDTPQQFISKIGKYSQQQQLKVLDQHPVGRLVKVDFNDQLGKDGIKNLMLELMSRPDIEYIVPNIKFKMLDVPNDPQFSQQWALEKINAPAAWDTSPGSREVVVAVIDTGVDYNHPDLAANIWVNPNEIAGNGIDDDGNGFADDIHGWDFRDNDNDPMDLTSDKNPGHGTHCAGIVGAVGNNATGITGISQVVSIMAVRFLGADGSGDLMSGAKAIDYAVQNKAHIISASWGAAVPESAAKPIVEAIQRAQEAGVLFIAAAANDGKNNDIRDVFPANTNLPNVISVAASQSDDTKPSWSNYGERKVHIASPGHNILSTLPGNKYGNLSGTSMATPLVSGLTALLLSVADQNLSGPEMRSLLQATGQQVNIETACHCRIDADKAITFVRDKTMTVVPNAFTLAPNESTTFTALFGQAPFTFKSSNPEVATIDEQGKLTAKAIGETTVYVTDATNTTAQSLTIHVANAPQPDPGQQCPLQDPIQCQLLCVINPQLPWCKM